MIFILYYLSATKKGYDYVISKDEAKEFLINCKPIDEKRKIYCLDTENGKNYVIDETLSEEASSKIGNAIKCSVKYTDESFEKEIDKSKEYSWDSWNVLEK